jgi:hypothetical protein
MLLPSLRCCSLVRVAGLGCKSSSWDVPGSSFIGQDVFGVIVLCHKLFFESSVDPSALEV